MENSDYKMPIREQESNKGTFGKVLNKRKKKTVKIFILHGSCSSERFIVLIC